MRESNTDGDGRRLPRPGDVAVAAAVLGALVGLGAADGGYYPRTWNLTALVLGGALALGLAGARRPPGGRLDALALGALGALVAWTAASVGWSIDPSQSILETERGLAYLAALALLLLGLRDKSPAGVLAAVAGAAAVLCTYAVVAELAETGGGGTPEARAPLAGPVGYSGTLGLLAAMGLLLALGFVARAGRPATRALAATGLVPTSAALALTGNRAGLVAVAAGLAAALALAPARRLLARAWAPALMAAGIAGWIAVSGGAGPGRLGIALALATAASAAAALATAGRRALSGGSALALLLAALVVAAPTTRGDAASGSARAARDTLAARHAGGSLEARRRLWDVAWETARERPLTGAGAGSFGRAWLRGRPVPARARDAHSLYLEAAAELGAVGLALLALLLGAPLAAAVRARRRPLVPAAAAAYVAYLVHAGAHWDWEMPVVTLAALACGAVLLVAARPPAPARPWRGGVRVAGCAAAAALVAASAGAIVANASLTRSQAAAEAAAWPEATAWARTATRWAFWSGEPWRILGEAALGRGEVRLARARFRRGLERDPGSWRLWAALARAGHGPGQRRAAAQAARLNPRRSELTRDAATR